MNQQLTALTRGCSYLIGYSGGVILRVLAKRWGRWA